MKLNQLQYVSAVSQHGSIRKAAQSCFVSEPAISKSLRELESEFNITLFERSHTGMTLTREGEDFMVYVGAIMEHHAKLKRRFLAKEADVRRQLKVAIRFPDNATDTLIHTINNMPAGEFYDIVMYAHNTSEILNSVAAGDVDLGIVTILSHFETYWQSLFAGKGLEFVPFGPREHPYIAMRESHPLSRKKKIKMVDLTPYTLLEIYAGNPASVSTVLANEVKNIVGIPTETNKVSVYDSHVYRRVMMETDSFSIVGAADEGDVFVRNGLVHYRINTDIVFINGVLKNTKLQLSELEQAFLDRLTNR